MVPGYDRWTKEIDTDVVIVGGGIVGCALAYELAREDVEVVLVERHDLNTQASGGNAGSLHVQIMSFQMTLEDARWQRIIDGNVRLYMAAVRTWQELAPELDVDVELHVEGGLMVAETHDQLERLELKATRERAIGLESDVLRGAELFAVAPYLSERHVIGAARCPIEGRINPALATPAIARSAERAGARILRHTAVGAISPGNRGFEVETARGRIRCKRVVNAAGCGAGEIAAMVGLHIPLAAPEVLHMNVTEPTCHFVDHLVQHAGMRLTFKQASNGSLIIGGGWDAVIDPATGLPAVTRASVQGNLWIAQRIVPELGHLRLVRTWAAANAGVSSGPILGEVSGLPGFFNAVFGDAGFTAGPICARIVADGLTGRAPSFDHASFAIERVQAGP
ncbi:MAG: FAD-binding oxidoreductase [Rhodospirillales bacterium]|jgi:glycine/D-amino acid oxidase-like deaminating enzyme|nr:FAD-binding oxidoreductase [Rhodospirillales bacterium]MDP6804455.1 FAD-binding oxidoreductase [Rhodospirillales bacterium]